MTRREVEELCAEDIVMLHNKNKKGSNTNQIPCRVLHVQKDGMYNRKPLALIEPLEGYEWTGTHNNYDNYKGLDAKAVGNQRWYNTQELKLIEKKAYKVKVRKCKGVH